MDRPASRSPAAVAAWSRRLSWRLATCTHRNPSQTSVSVVRDAVDHGRHRVLDADCPPIEEPVIGRHRMVERRGRLMQQGVVERRQHQTLSSSRVGPRRSGDHLLILPDQLVVADLPGGHAHPRELRAVGLVGQPIDRAPCGLQAATQLVHRFDLQPRRIAVDALEHGRAADEGRVLAVADEVTGEHPAQEAALVAAQAGEQQELLVGRAVAIGVGRAGPLAVLRTR